MMIFTDDLSITPGAKEANELRAILTRREQGANFF